MQPILHLCCFLNFIMTIRFHLDLLPLFQLPSFLLSLCRYFLCQVCRPHWLPWKHCCFRSFFCSGINCTGFPSRDFTICLCRNYDKCCTLRNWQWSDWSTLFPDCRSLPFWKQRSNNESPSQFLLLGLAWSNSHFNSAFHNFRNW